MREGGICRARCRAVVAPVSTTEALAGAGASHIGARLAKGLFNDTHVEASRYKVVHQSHAQWRDCGQDAAQRHEGNKGEHGIAGINSLAFNLLRRFDVRDRANDGKAGSAGQ